MRTMLDSIRSDAIYLKFTQILLAPGDFSR